MQKLSLAQSDVDRIPVIYLQRSNTVAGFVIVRVVVERYGVILSSERPDAFDGMAKDTVAYDFERRSYLRRERLPATRSSLCSAFYEPDIIPAGKRRLPLYLPKSALRTPLNRTIRCNDLVGYDSVANDSFTCTIDALVEKHFFYDVLVVVDKKAIRSEYCTTSSLMPRGTRETHEDFSAPINPVPT